MSRRASLSTSSSVMSDVHLNSLRSMRRQCSFLFTASIYWWIHAARLSVAGNNRVHRYLCEKNNCLGLGSKFSCPHPYLCTHHTVMFALLSPLSSPRVRYPISSKRLTGQAVHCIQSVVFALTTIHITLHSHLPWLLSPVSYCRFLCLCFSLSSFLWVFSFSVSRI